MPQTPPRPAGQAAERAPSLLPMPSAPVTETRRCGPIEAPERLGVLPANAEVSPADMVCVAKVWISVGRGGDAVFQLTRALQNSPNRVYGPASLELARLYDPLRATPNWPPNAAFAEEKYREAMNDGNFPDIQREAREGLEALRKAAGR